MSIDPVVKVVGVPCFPYSLCVFEIHGAIRVCKAIRAQYLLQRPFSSEKGRGTSQSTSLTFSPPPGHGFHGPQTLSTASFTSFIRRLNSSSARCRGEPYFC